MRVFGIFLLLALVGCAPRLGVSETQRSEWAFQQVISNFKPDRGTGSTYKVGDFATFGFTLSKPGYVSLVGLDPDGSLQELERNVPLAAGSQTLPLKTDINAQGARAAYQLVEPTGPETMWLIFTDVPGPADARFRGKPSAEEFSKLLYKFIAPSTTRDVAETKFEVVK